MLLLDGVIEWADREDEWPSREYLAGRSDLCVADVADGVDDEMGILLQKLVPVIESVVEVNDEDG